MRRSHWGAIGFALFAAAPAMAQSTVYRCPGPPVVYTDALTPAEAKSKGCPAIDGAPISVCGLKNRKTGKIHKPCPAQLEVAADGQPQGDSINFYTAPDTSKPTWTPPQLGPIDKWRYESCQKDAAQAPTEMGVRRGTRLCHIKFEQLPPCSGYSIPYGSDCHGSK